MGKNLSKLDILALSASGDAAKKLTAFLQDLKQDVAGAISLQKGVFHLGVDVKLSDGSDYIESANLAASRIASHLASTGLRGVHKAASGGGIASPEATDLASAITLANEVKGVFNLHLDESGVHLMDDTTEISASDATDEASLNVLLTAIKTVYNVHRNGSMASAIVG